MKWIIIVLVVILGVIGISGCTDSGVSQNTKHFDNGVVAFDYPSNMVVLDHGIAGITVNDGSTVMVNIAIQNYTAQSNHTTINDNNMKNLDPSMNVTKKIINGRTAYNIIQKNGNRTSYFTFIDIGTGQIQILPSSYPNVPDQKDTPFYQTYQVILNSFQVK